MHRRIVVTLALAAVMFAGSRPAARQTVTVDEVIAKNLAARGGLEKMRTINSLKQVSRVTMAGSGEARLTVYMKRPNLQRQEMLVAGMTNIQAFDGQTAWGINALQGMTTPVVLPGPQAEAIKAQAADIDGPLVDFKSKGYTVEYVGTTTMNGHSAYHLQVATKNQPVHHVYIDVNTNLEFKVVADVPNGPMETEQSDFREVEGLKMPFSIRYLLGGNEQARMTVEKLELNPVLDDAIFKMPKGQ